MPIPFYPYSFSLSQRKVREARRRKQVFQTRIKAIKSSLTRGDGKESPKSDHSFFIIILIPDIWILMFPLLIYRTLRRQLLSLVNPPQFQYLNPDV